MGKLLGRAEYLSNEDIEKNRLIGRGSNVFSDINEAMDDFSYPIDLMLHGIAGTGKTFYVKKKMAEGLKADYCMLDKKTLEYVVEDTSAPIMIIDDFNYLFEAARYCELNGLDNFNTKHAFETIAPIYNYAKQNEKSVLLLSTEGIWSLSTLLKPEIRKHFVKKFAWALDPREAPTDIMLKYKKPFDDEVNKSYYKKKNAMFSIPEKRVYDFRKELIVEKSRHLDIAGEEGKLYNQMSDHDKEEYNQLLIRDEFNLIDLPSVIPAYDAYKAEKPRFRLGKYHELTMTSDGKGLRFGSIHFAGKQPENYNIKWKMIELPRRLEVVKQVLGEISAQNLDLKPRNSVTDSYGQVEWPENTVMWDGDEIIGAINRINQVFISETRTVDWYQLVADIAKSDSHEAVQGAYLRYDISRQTP